MDQIKLARHNIRANYSLNIFTLYSLSLKLIQSSVWDLCLGCDFLVTLVVIGLRIRVRTVGRIQESDALNQSQSIYVF